MTPGSGGEPWTVVSRLESLTPEYVWTGEEIVLVGGGETDAPLAVYDADAGRWRQTGTVSGDVVRPVWTGSRIVGWPGSGGTEPIEFELG